MSKRSRGIQVKSEENKKHWFIWGIQDESKLINIV